MALLPLLIVRLVGRRPIEWGTAYLISLIGVASHLALDLTNFYGVRLLLPFSDGGDVTHIIASLKTIIDNGSFEIKNLMRGNDKLPVPKLRAVIDRDLFHRAPGRIPSGDALEFG